MDLTPDKIINAVCRALELDRDKMFEIPTRGRQEKGFFAKGKIDSNKYYEAECITAYLIRLKTAFPKETKKYGKEMKPPTYKEVAYIFKRKSHEAIIRRELECRIKLRDKNPEFKAKYDMVVNLLDNNVNVA